MPEAAELWLAQLTSRRIDFVIGWSSASSAALELTIWDGISR
jgi:hypothetical protein